MEGIKGRKLNSGEGVFCMGNFSTGNTDNTQHLVDNQHLEVKRYDITLPLHIEADRIFNLVCVAAPLR